MSHMGQASSKKALKKPSAGSCAATDAKVLDGKAMADMVELNSPTVEDVLKTSNGVTPDNGSPSSATGNLLGGVVFLLTSLEKLDEAVSIYIDKTDKKMQEMEVKLYNKYYQASVCAANGEPVLAYCFLMLLTILIARG